MSLGHITFPEGKDREHLVRTGSVYTLRTQKRTTGETHVRFKHTGQKQFDVVVEEIDMVNPRDDFSLSPYLEDSGFSTLTEWREAIRDAVGRVPSESYVYHVRAVDGYRKQLERVAVP
jgi:hypothetical protein